jgi:hypothetical protein
MSRENSGTNGDSVDMVECAGEAFRSIHSSWTWRLGEGVKTMVVQTIDEVDLHQK